MPLAGHRLSQPGVAENCWRNWRLATREKATGVRTSGPGGGNSLTGDLWTQHTAGDKAAEVVPGLSPHLFGV